MSSSNNLKTSDLHAKLMEMQLKRQQVEERLRREAEAEAEAELRREIVEAEECECEAALRLEEDRKVAEMQWKLEKLWEAEEIRRAQVSLSRVVEAMEVDIKDGGDRGAKLPEGTEDKEEEEETKTKKGKEKKGRWEIVGGSRRCKACRKEGMPCIINLHQIELWQQRVWEGKKFTKALPDTSKCRGRFVSSPCLWTVARELRRW